MQFIVMMVSAFFLQMSLEQIVKIYSKQVDMAWAVPMQVLFLASLIGFVMTASKWITGMLG